MERKTLTLAYDRSTARDDAICAPQGTLRRLFVHCLNDVCERGRHLRYLEDVGGF